MQEQPAQSLDSLSGIVIVARFMTLADIAGWLSLSRDTVRTVVQRRLEKDYRRIGYRKVHEIAIDELYLGRARKCITLVSICKAVEQGRGSGALREFWRRFKLSGARLKAVAMDMSGPMPPAFALTPRTLL